MRGDRVISGIARHGAAGAVVLAFVGIGSGAAQESVETPLYIAVAGVGGAMSTLTIAYPSDPGLDQAQRDLAELTVLGRWEVSAPQRADTDSGVLYESQISPAVTLDAQGQVPIFPFLSAFRRFPTIKFGFVGDAAGTPGDYHDANRYLEAQWTRAGRSVTFEFRIKDSSFQTAEDVRLTDRPADQPLPAPGRGAGGRPPAASLWVLLLVGSAGTGVFVWGLTWWLLTRRAPAEERPKEVETAPEGNGSVPDDTAETEVTVSAEAVDETAAHAAAREAAPTDA